MLTGSTKRNLCLQVFFHLGELDDAVTYALGAGKLFDLDEKSEYVDTLLGTSIGKTSMNQEWRNETSGGRSH